MSQAFQQVLLENQIKQTTTSPYSPFQNGKSERSWRSLMEMARCSRLDADVPKSYWPYAVRYAQYLRNRSFQRRTHCTAYELFTGQKPDMRKLQQFGTPCIVYNEGPKQKLDARGREAIFLGINPQNKGYFTLCQKTGQVKTSLNVSFPQEIGDEQDLSSIIRKPAREEQPKEQSSNKDNVDTPSGDPEVTAELPQRERSQRNTGPPKYLADYYLSTTIDYAYLAIASIPLTYEEAIKSPDAENWKAAMDCEIKTLHDNHTWKLTKLPHDRSETKGRWVYTIKQGKQPGNVQFKARYVARGFSQIQGLDYEETFSPTTRFTSIRMLLQKAATENLHIHQMDVKGAYLNAPIDKEIYVQQPPGYVN